MKTLLIQGWDGEPAEMGDLLVLPFCKIPRGVGIPNRQYIVEAVRDGELDVSTAPEYPKHWGRTEPRFPLGMLVALWPKPTEV